MSIYHEIEGEALALVMEVKVSHIFVWLIKDYQPLYALLHENYPILPLA